MIRWLISKRLTVSEQRIGVPQEYLRHMLRVSLRAFWTFARFVPLANYRRALPASEFHVARIVATRDADCGACVQIAVNLARQNGVPAEILRHVLAFRPEHLPAELADIYRFAEAVVRGDGSAAELRQRIRQRYGEEALIELAMAIAMCRVFPFTKRALGDAESCSRVQVHV